MLFRSDRLRLRQQRLAKEIGGRYFRTHKWVLIAFDGSRSTAPRSIANEKAFCAPNYGHGTKAKYGKKKSKGLRRKRNKEHKTQPQEPQVWITMMWHMGLRLPWTWRLGPSNSSERRTLLADRHRLVPRLLPSLSYTSFLRVSERDVSVAISFQFAKTAPDCG